VVDGQPNLSAGKFLGRKTVAVHSATIRTQRLISLQMASERVRYLADAGDGA